MKDQIRNRTFTVPEGDCFEHEYIVNYSEMSSKGRLRPSAVVNYFQNLAVLHSDAAGYSVEKLQSQNSGWVLTGWHIRFGELPRESTRVIAQTWADTYRRTQADRDFALIDEDGVFAYASSRWFLMNTERRRPLKLDKEFFAAYQFETPRTVSQEDYKIDFPEDAPELSTFSIPVMRRDTDTNRHVNNAVYVDWAMDGVPDEIYDSCELTELMVIYKKECRQGNQVRGTLYKNGKDILCILTDDNDPETEFGRALMHWE